MFPKFTNIPQQTSFTVNKFRGINVTESYEPGEVTECSNISAAAYPALCARAKRSVFSECKGIINGTGSFNGIFYTYYLPETGALFLHFNNMDYEFTKVSNFDNPATKRKFAALENCIVIIPDNIIFFTDSLTFETIDFKQVYNYEDAREKFLAETNNSNLINTNNFIKRGLLFHNNIQAYQQSYYHSGKNMDFYFIAFDPVIKAGDVLTIKMDVSSEAATGWAEYTEYLKKMKNGITVKVKSVEKTSHITPVGIIEETTKLIFDDNAIDTGGYSDTHFTNITIERKMPEVSSIAAFNNRVWGVSGNKICASRLGSADEWNDFSVDSYGTLPTSSFAVSAGSDGVFTAIIPHGNYIYALKENHIHKIYGDTPDEFTVSGIDGPGTVANADTICVCGVNLIYVSGSGVCILRDGYPKVISRKIGDVSPVCAASSGGKYYLICQVTDSRVMYIYDSEHDLWTMESCYSDADNLCCDGKNIYFSNGGELICLSDSSGSEYEKYVNWSFRLRFDAGRFSPATSLRAVAAVKLEKDSSFTVRAIYDDDTRGALCGFCYDETPNGCTNLQLPIKRDLGFCLEFKGVGDFALRRIKFNYYKSDTE